MQGADQAAEDGEGKRGTQARGARLPEAEPEPEHDSQDELGAGDEMVAHDAEAKQALTGDRASDSQVASLAASGLWEHVDDAEHFFAKGLEIMQVARRKDESARRRYMPSKDKRAVRPAQGGEADGTRDDRGARGKVCGKRRGREPCNGHLQPGLQARCARRLSDSLRDVRERKRARARWREKKDASERARKLPG